MRPPSLPQALLALAGFLAIIAGGYIPIEPQPLDPGFSSLMGSLFRGMNVPLASHAIVAALVASAFVVHWSKNRVIQLPFSHLTGAIAVFGVLILLSLASTAFPWTTLASLAEWLTYLMAMAAAWSICGRKEGPVWVLGAIAAGCTVNAVLAIWEYAGTRSQDPTWRVFGLWMNPNALAGMLLLGLFASFGLMLRHSRVPALIWGASSTLTGLAILLTQSKGAILIAIPAGLATLGVALFSWLRPGKASAFPLLRIAAVIAATTVLIIVFRGGTPSGPVHTAKASPALLGRVASSGAEEHSTAFRLNLWKSALEIMRRSPMGTGLGTFKQNSTRPEISQQTHLAHQSFLQIASEAGIAALVAFVAIGIFWVVECFRGARSLAPESNLLRAGVLSAVLAAAAHSLVDSDLYYFGSGLAFFVLLGVGLALSADALTPEQVVRPLRSFAAGSAVLVSAFFVYAGIVQVVQARLVGDLFAQRIDEAQAGAELLRAYGSLDPLSWSLIANCERTPDARLEALKRSAELGPAPRAWRALARAQIESGQSASALASLQQALRWDANNLPALKLFMDLQIKDGDRVRAVETARRLVEVESKPYFQVRATPEFVPLETYEARLFLAETEPDPTKRASILKTAVDGFAAFLATTVPKVKFAAAIDPTIVFGGVALQDCIDAMRQGESAAGMLRNAYRTIGDGPAAKSADEAVSRFAAMARELEDLKR